MTKRDQDFLARWHTERPDYERWGRYVVDRLKERLAQELGPKAAKGFLRLPVEPRLKDDVSLLQKAFYRGKGYEEKGHADPFDAIEDKVGVRFVVLLAAHVNVVGRLVREEEAAWNSVKARDHEEEIEAKPYEFGYQSLHYVVRSKPGIEVDGKPIPADLPCEIQIRTLLQHAYSEITHDTLYKPSITATPKMKRAAAKSMALIEATSDYFSALDELIAQEVQPLTDLDAFLSARYAELVGVPAMDSETPLNQLILDHYGRFHASTTEALEPWLAGNKFIGERIAERRSARSVFRLPSILLVYFYADNEPYRAKKDSPLPDSELELIYGDVGQSLEG
ncbi:RelA/SpoT domain-containing protein [Defluviimonas sp. WL0024]|uniref:RelA/SpoT domain-containing protein n=1 Tax=Albidovulum salinarum TaxID=2984153 RepID=A0ABT2X8T1_9RHOB|nr:RelA/SpoT domain-containing protein [Defluviimonas sp. WL0024]MCU9850361.1 RelA/SpoT domain-containing protein [Defluviimonas sp. WL0024]